MVCLNLAKRSNTRGDCFASDNGLCACNITVLTHLLTESGSESIASHRMRAHLRRRPSHTLPNLDFVPDMTAAPPLGCDT